MQYSSIGVRLQGNSVVFFSSAEFSPFRLSPTLGPRSPPQPDSPAPAAPAGPRRASRGGELDARLASPADQVQELVLADADARPLVGEDGLGEPLILAELPQEGTDRRGSAGRHRAVISLIHRGEKPVNLRLREFLPLGATACLRGLRRRKANLRVDRGSLPPGSRPVRARSSGRASDREHRRAAAC